MAGLKPEFDKRNCKIIGLSVDPVDDHTRWSKDIEETQGHRVTYPMIGDPELKVAKAYDMLLPSRATRGRGEPRPTTPRSVGLRRRARQEDQGDADLPDEHRSQLRRGAPAARLCQLTAKHKVATPVNWKQGDDVIIVPAVSDARPSEKYPQRLEDTEAVHPDRAAAPVAVACPPLAALFQGGGEGWEHFYRESDDRSRAPAAGLAERRGRRRFCRAPAAAEGRLALLQFSSVERPCGGGQEAGRRARPREWRAMSARGC